MKLQRKLTLLGTDKYAETKRVMHLKHVAVEEERKKLAEIAEKQRNLAQQISDTPVAKSEVNENLLPEGIKAVVKQRVEQELAESISMLGTAKKRTMNIIKQRLEE